MFIYLGSPYSNPSPQIVDLRYRETAEAAAYIATCGIPVYAPIVAWHPTAIRHRLPPGFEFWQKQDEAFLSICHAGWFLKLDGWQESKGVKFEVEYLKSLSIPVELLFYSQLEEVCAKLLKSLRPSQMPSFKPQPTPSEIRE